MRNFYSILLLALLLVCAAACGVKNTEPDKPTSPVVILYDNDVHCAVDGYAAMAALKKAQGEKTPYVTVATCGDFVQGDIVGSITKGEGVIDIMNQTGYDLITLGNHEFDFGMEQHKILIQKLLGEPICANFTDLTTNQPVYKPYEIIRYGKVDIAFIGMATPATATSTSPKTFWDKNGNPKYSFLPNNLFPTIQKYVDEARSNGADYVVVMAHMGAVKEESFPTSLELIANTTGIDAVLDGHSHSVIPDSTVLNLAGEGVVLSSSGSKFENIGILTLSTEGKFSAQLVKSSTVEPDTSVQKFIEEVKQSALEAGERIIGTSEITLYALDADDNWLVRDRETPIGNFCADAFRCLLGTDIAMLNGGGIRSNLPAGDISYNLLLSVFPFNNTACTASITGQQLLDALEVSVMLLPETAGRFMQVSGIKFKVNAKVKSPVVLDESGMFSHIGNNSRRVSNVEILDKESQEYKPVDLSKTYSLGSVSYNITDLGSEGIFRYAKLLQDNLGQDAEILAAYLQQLGGVIGEEYSKTQGRIIINL